MGEHIEAIYKDGVLRPSKPLDFPENSVVEIEVRDIKGGETDKEKWLEEFDEWMENLDSDTPGLTDEQISRESIYEEQLKKQL